jgi:hypothetical protein
MRASVHARARARARVCVCVLTGCRCLCVWVSVRCVCVCVRVHGHVLQVAGFFSGCEITHMRWMTHRDTGAFRGSAPSLRQPPKPLRSEQLNSCSRHSTMARPQHPPSHSRVWQPASCPGCACFQMRSRRFRDSGRRRPRGPAARRETAREADQSRLGAVAAWIAMGPACAGKLLVGLLQSEAAASIRVGAVHIEHGAVHIEDGAQARRPVPAIVPLQATLPACQ